MNLLLAFVCNFETTFSAFKSNELDGLEEHIVLNTSSENKNNFVVQILVVSCEDKEIVDADNHPFKEIFKNGNHDLLESETSNGDSMKGDWNFGPTE